MLNISPKLYVRVALAIALVALIISAFASVFSYYFGLESRQQTNYLLAEQLSATVEKTAVIAVYVNDSELALEIANGLVVNDLIKGVSLTSDAGLNIMSGELTDKAERISTSLYHPFLPGTQLGNLSIYLDDKFIKRQTADATQREILILVTHSLIIAFFVSMLVHRRLTKPIQRLVDKFDNIDPHSPTTMRMLTYKGDDEIGKLVKGINTLMHELHHSYNMERNLRLKTQALESKFRLIFEQASAGICLVDDNDMITSYNPAFAAYFDAEQALDSTHFPTLLTNTDRLQQLLREIRSKSQVEQVALDIECKVGDKQKWMHCLFAKVTDQRSKLRGEPSSVIEVILYDVTERAERELQTRFEADHDSLTHLLNRRSGEKKLHKMLYACIKHQHPLVLMMIDLDKFKPVNDKYGHEAGDKVLVEVAERLVARFPSDDEICIRWGGDEFVVAFHVDDVTRESVQSQTEFLLNDIKQPIRIMPDVDCAVDASIGVVVAPEHGKVLHDLLVNADNTMYNVKEHGRGRIEFYQPS